MKKVAVAVVLLAVAVIAQAQQPAKVPRIGYLSSGNPASESSRSEAIRMALRELGYTEGQNIAIEYRYAEGKWDRFPELAAELVRLKVDIIVVAGGMRLIRPAMNTTKTIPIVMVGRGVDPVEAGLVKASPVPAATSPALQTLAHNLAGSGLSCSKRPFPKLPVSRFSTNRTVRPV
jgi:putative tryptophan/tyrosine transport system substrate-binding protein